MKVGKTVPKGRFNRIQKHCPLLRARTHLDQTDHPTMETCIVHCQTGSLSWTACAADTKKKRTIQSKSQGLSWHGVLSVPLAKVTCEGNINSEQYVLVWQQHMLPLIRHLYQKRPLIFHQDNAKPHSVSITKA